MKAKKITILVLVGVILVGLFSGCKKSVNNSNSLSGQKTLSEKELEELTTETASDQNNLSRQELENLTVELVKEINKKSDLGDYGLLEPQPYPMEIPGSGMMNDGKDSFNCYPYADGYYVTRVFLSSAETNVLGISNGQKEDEADVVLQNEGFQKLSEKETENFFLAKEKGIAYAKYDITIAFRLSQDTELIDKMIVVVKRPIDDELTF